MSQQTQNNAAADPSSSGSIKRTPAQREKKRAQDRQSQRNVRNRTKQHIANLEARVNELSSYEGLSHLISANEGLRAQNDELITALRSIATLVERVCRSAAAGSKPADNKPIERMFRSPSWPTPSQSPEDQTRTQRGSTVYNDLGKGLGDHSQGHRPYSMAATSPRSYNNQMESEYLSRDHSSTHINPDNGQSFETRTYPIHQTQVEAENGYASLSGSNLNPHDPWTSQGMSPSSRIEDNMVWEASSKPMARKFAVRGLFHIGTSSSSGSLTAINQSPLSPHPSELTHPPKSQICPPTNMWDAKLTAFIQQYRTSSSAHFIKQVAEPGFPSVDIFVYPERISTDTDPITMFLAEVMIPWNFRLPECLAFFYLNYIFIKWAIAPTPANTRHLPEWYLPKPPQSETSHPLYIDTIPWPEMRNKITFQYPTLEFISWVTSFCHNLNISWKHDPTLTYVTELDGATRISPALHSHLRDLSNWTLDPPFAVTYPYLALT